MQNQNYDFIHSLLFKAASFTLPLLIGFGLSLQGQDTDGEDIFILDPFEVSVEDNNYVPTSSVVASGFALENVKNPISIASLSDQFVDDLKFDDLADAVGYLSGAVKSPNTDGSLHGSRIRVRGFETTWFNRNGVRRYLINGTDNLNRLEVVKGPAAVFFGQAAPGGILNYVTKRPSFTPIVSIEGRYGSYDYKRVEVEAQGPLFSSDKLAYRINSSYLDKEDWRDFEYQERTFYYGGILYQPIKKIKLYAEYERIKDTNNDALAMPQGNPVWMEDYMRIPDADNAVTNFYAANPALIFPADEAADASRDDVIERLQGRWRNSSGGGSTRWRDDTALALGIDPETIPFEDRIVPDATPYGYRWNNLGPAGFVEHDLENITLEGTWTVFDWFSLRGSAIWDDAYRKAFISNGQIFNMSAEGPTFNNQKLSLAGLFNETLTLSLQGVFEFSIGPAENTILVGMDKFDDDFLEVLREDNSTGEVGASWNYFTDGYPVQDFGDSTIKKGGVNHNNIRRSQFVNYVGRFWDSKLVLMAGLREENFTRKVPDSELGTRTVLEAEEVTPAYGMVFEFIEGINLFASYSKSFDANGSGAKASVNSNVRDDAERDRLLEALGLDRFGTPTTGKGWDIGLKSNWRDDTVSGTLSYFKVMQNNRFSVRDDAETFADPLNQDYLAANPDATVTQLPVQRFTHFGEAEVTGIEADIIIQPKRELSIILSYTHLFDAIVDRSDGDTLRVRGAPTNNFSIWGKYTFTEGLLENFSFGAGMIISSSYLGREREGNKYFLEDGYTTFDALVEYKIPVGEDHRLKVSLNLKNLTDERYFSGGVGSPAENRRAMLTVKYDF